MPVSSCSLDRQHNELTEQYTRNTYSKLLADTHLQTCLNVASLYPSFKLLRKPLRREKTFRETSNPSSQLPAPYRARTGPVGAGKAAIPPALRPGGAVTKNGHVPLKRQIFGGARRSHFGDTRQSVRVETEEVKWHRVV